MKTYRVAINVRKLYHVTVKAEDEEAARMIGNMMRSTTIYQRGTLNDVSTDVVEDESGVVEIED